METEGKVSILVPYVNLKETKIIQSSRLKEITPKGGAHLLNDFTYSRTFLYKNFMLFLKGSDQEKKHPDCLVFDLEKSEWQALIPKGTSLLDTSLDFSICAYGKNKIVLYGAVVARDNRNNNGAVRRRRSRSRDRSKSPRRNNQPCCQILNIEEGAKIRVGDPSPFEAEWEEINPRELRYYRQCHTAHVFENRLIGFGGVDESMIPYADIFTCDLSSMIRFIDKRSNFEGVVNRGGSIGSRSRSRSRERVYSRSKAEYRDANRITARYSHSGVIHQDKIYYYGGLDQEGNTLHDMWTYNPRNGEWQPITMKGLIPTPRAGSLAQISGDTIFFLGGMRSFVEYPELMTYDINTNTWKILDDKISLDSGPKALAIYQNTPIIGRGLKLYSFQTGKSYKHIKPTTSSDSSFKPNDRQLFTNKPFHDITFNVEGTLVPAHKALLASRSSHFRNMFQSGMKESTSTVIDFPEMNLSIFNGFLEYLYCGEVKELTESVAVELLKVADKYAVSGLRDLSEQFLVDKLGVDNVVDLTNLADVCGANRLFEAGLSFMAENFEEVFKKHDIKRLSSTTLVQLFEQK